MAGWFGVRLFRVLLNIGDCPCAPPEHTLHAQTRPHMRTEHQDEKITINAPKIYTQINARIRSTETHYVPLKSTTIHYDLNLAFCGPKASGNCNYTPHNGTQRLGWTSAPHFSWNLRECCLQILHAEMCPLSLFR